jgi:hypothetical protein
MRMIWLANKVASEEHGIYDAFGEEDLKHFLDLMVDIKIRALEVTAPLPRVCKNGPFNRSVKSFPHAEAIRSQVVLR